MRISSRFPLLSPARGFALVALAGAVWVPTAAAQDATTAGAAWTTFKGNTQRSGATAAQVGLPLSLQWRFSSEGPARSYNTSPLVVGAPGNQRVIFASGRFVYALDSQTGQQIWRSPELSADIVTPLTLLSTDAGDLVVGAQQNGRITALDTAKGGLAWTPADARTSLSDAGPIIVDTPKGKLIVSVTNNGRIIAVNAQGNLDPTWRSNLGDGVSPATALTLSSDGKKLFLLSTDARLFTLDAFTGRVLYVVPQGRRSGGAPISDGANVITANQARVASFNSEDGRAVWTFTPRGDILASPALIGEGATRTMFFGTRNGYFQAVNAATGKLAWEKKFDVIFTGSPLALPGAIIVGTSSGVMMGFNPQNGDLIWQNRLQTERARRSPRRATMQAMQEGGGAPEATVETLRTFPISSAPAAINGQVFVLGDNAALYAFTSGAFDADPVRVVEPSLAVPGVRARIVSLALSPQTPVVIRGDGPIYLAALLDDVGSGVDVANLRVTLDNTVIAADRVAFDAASGTLTVTVLDPTKRDAAFEDGLKNLSIVARDYAGNEMTYTTSFLVDKTAPAPQEPEPEEAGAIGGGGEEQPRRRNRRNAE